MTDLTDTTASQPPDGGNPSSKKRRRTITKILLPLIIIALGLAVGTYLKRTAPKASRRPPVAMVPLVQVETLSAKPQKVVVEAMGTVVAARQIQLKSRVAGEIIFVHEDFIEGGLLKAGTEILRIDPKDYQLALAQKKRALADAQFEFEVEQGYQAVAKREWELLAGDGQPDDLNADLALRKPHLERARARIEAARADLEQAQLDLERTVVRAPFNAIVLTKQVDIGTRTTANEALALLVDADQFWVRVAVPLEQLRWIKLPSQTNAAGAKARILYRDQYQRPALVSKLLNDLGEAGQMARLIATVEDPLGIAADQPNPPPLLLGEVVQVEIEGGRVENAITIPRRALRDQDRIWIMSADGRLEIRPVTIAWRGQQSVLVTEGVSDGERLIVSDLATPVAGMQLKVDQAPAGAAAPNPTLTGSAPSTPK
jgi:RND family efflux transporter MFP subunit